MRQAPRTKRHRRVASEEDRQASLRCGKRTVPPETERADHTDLRTGCRSAPWPCPCLFAARFEKRLTKRASERTAMKRFSVICLRCGLSVDRLIDVETAQTE